MENVLDEDWELLLDVYRKVDHPDFHLCLDIGHAHCYSEIPVLTWAEELAPYVTHVHVHDNCGDPGCTSGAWKRYHSLAETTEPASTYQREKLDDRMFTQRGCSSLLAQNTRGQSMNRLKQRGLTFLVLLTTAGMMTGCGGSSTPDLEKALAKNRRI